LGKESEEIKRWIESGPFRDRFSIETVFATTENQLRHALLRYKPHILHFSGHGSEEGLILEDDGGNIAVFELVRLARLLKALPGNLRMLVLNACYSGLQSEELRQAVDVLIAMNHQILDRNAIGFSSALYLGIGFNSSVQECFDLALSSVRDGKVTQSNVPLMCCRKGINPGRIHPLDWLTSGVETSERAEVPRLTEPAEAAIQIAVVVSGRDRQHRENWKYSGHPNQIVFQRDGDQAERLTPEEMWPRVSAAVQSVPQVRSNAVAAPDVFLILRDSLISNLYAHETLATIVSSLREASFGASLYVVCEQEVPFNSIYNKTYREVIEKWFEMLIVSGVTDLIELPKTHKKLPVDGWGRLRAGAQSSQMRRARLNQLISADDWAIELRPGSSALKRFLERVNEPGLTFAGEKNLAVFYDQKPKLGWSELLKNSRTHHRTGKWFVAMHSRGSLKDLKDVEELWLQESKELRPSCFNGIFEFQGTFEWLYAICRLRFAAQLARLSSVNVARKAMF